MLGSSIKKLRKIHNVTQNDLAQWLGVSRQAISMWEANKREIKASTLNKIANVFGVTVDEVLGIKLDPATRKEGKMLGRIMAKKVSFELVAPQANRVALTGDFKNWDRKGIPMKKDKDGTWRIEVPLPPGRYEYKFIVDNEWKTDPANTQTSGNSFGTLNSVKEFLAK